MGGGSGGASLKLKKAAKRFFLRCTRGSSFCHKQQQIHVHHNSTVPCDSPNFSSPLENLKTNISCKKNSSEITGQANSTTSPSSTKDLCTICLDPLNYSSGSKSGQAIFTAQCSHAFHFACISSNVRHGSLTCPICRAHWTQLPRNLNTRCSLHYNRTDPVLQILDASIANSRVHRRSFLRSARYDDDDPIDNSLDHQTDLPRLHLSLLTVPLTQYEIPSHHLSGSSSMTQSPQNSPFMTNGTYLHIKLAPQPAMDLVLVASPNGPHLRLMKQAMALVVFSLRPIDRLAIVTYSSSASRVFPLRRMMSYGKRTALQVIDRLFYMGQADLMEGFNKGVKVLNDRVHPNQLSCILHMTDCPVRSYHQFDTEVPFPIHQFNVGFGFGTSNKFIMHEFEEFLTRTLEGGISDVQLRVRERTGIVRIGKLRGGEERNVPLYLGESGHVCVEYSYVDDGDGGCFRTGEIVIEVRDTGDGNKSRDDSVPVGGRISSSGESWDYHDTFMARRWAKHLHEYRL